MLLPITPRYHPFAAELDPIAFITFLSLFSSHNAHAPHVTLPSLGVRQEVVTVAARAQQQHRRVLIDHSKIIVILGKSLPTLGRVDANREAVV